MTDVEYRVYRVEPDGWHLEGTYYERREACGAKRRLEGEHPGTACTVTRHESDLFRRGEAADGPETARTTGGAADGPS